MSDCKRDCWKCHWCWLGRCVHCANYGKDVSVPANQPQDCQAYITKEDWNRQYAAPISQERCMEIINAFINNLSVAESNTTVLKQLLHIGLTKDELVNHFHFTESDVQDVIEDMEKEED